MAKRDSETVYLEALKLRREEVIKEWIRALKSGKYDQGKGRLRDREDRYCCLGVLCDIVRKRWVPTYEWEREKDGGYIFSWDDTVASTKTYLPRDLAAKLGILAIEEALALMNDYGASFNVIAGYVEREVGGK